jgi:hypothetical protein
MLFYMTYASKSWQVPFFNLKFAALGSLKRLWYAVANSFRDTSCDVRASALLLGTACMKIRICKHLDGQETSAFCAGHNREYRSMSEYR